MNVATLFKRLNRLQANSIFGFASLLRAARVRRHALTADELRKVHADRDARALAFYLSGAQPKSIAEFLMRSRGRRLATPAALSTGADQ